MTSCGWRQLTPGLYLAEKMALDNGIDISVDKHRALVAFKKAAPYLGISQVDVLIIDTLIAFSRNIDWEEGQRPVVWPSNQLLMERCALGLRSLQRHMRALSERGLIAFRDSPNGQRYGKRDSEGYIIDAYGFDLSPLAVRTQEFEDLYHTMSEERRVCQQIKRSITVLRRSIRMSIETALEQGFSGDWAAKRKTFSALMADIVQAKGRDMLSKLETRFRQLQVEIMQLYEKGLGLGADNADEGSGKDCNALEKQEDVTTKETNMSPKHAISDTLILTTNQLPYVNCNGASAPSNRQRNKIPDGVPEKPVSSSQSGALVYPDMVLNACPAFADFVDLPASSRVQWRDITKVTGKLASMMGISQDAWNCARATMGVEKAAVALAITLERHTSGDVKNPGGYLRAMTERADCGKLHLARSIFARL